MTYAVAAIVASFLVSVGITWLCIRLAHRHALHAVPNHRSSHDIPTPQLGGIGVALLPLIVLLGINIALLVIPEDKFPRQQFFMYFAMLAGALGFGALGLWDDLAHLAPKFKLAGQLIVAAVSVFFLQLAGIQYIGIESGFLLKIFGIGFAFCWFVGFVNAFNFMDGMNGKSGSFAMLAIAAIIYFVAMNDGILFYSKWVMFDVNLCTQVGFTLFNFILLASIAGFLIFNLRPRAKIFLGDCGSHFLGFVIAYQTLVASESWFDHPSSFVVYAILLMPFLYDVAFTLIKRAKEGKALWEAHREHLYQRLMICGMGHMKVLGICGTNFIVCALLALLASKSDSAGMRFFFFLVSLLAMLVYTAYVFSQENKKPSVKNLQ